MFNLATWVLQAPGKWVELQPVDLRTPMHSSFLGDLVHMKLSVKMSDDQLRRFRFLSFAAFCEEGIGTLLLVMVMTQYSFPHVVMWPCTGMINPFL
jgi:hypothetical protein